MKTKRLSKIIIFSILACSLFSVKAFAGEPISAISAIPPAAKGAQRLHEESTTVISKEKPALEIAKISGDVQVRCAPSKEWQRAKKGQKLHMKDSIRTRDRGKVRLKFPDGSFVLVKDGTELTVEELAWHKRVQRVGIDLTIGQIKAVVKSMKLKSKFEVRTPTATMGVRGTVFYAKVFNMLIPSENPGEPPVDPIVTELFVESGIVDFKNLISDILQSLTGGSGSASYDDGRMTEPRMLSSEEKKQWQAGWGIKDTKKKGKAEEKKSGGRKGKADEKLVPDSGGGGDPTLGDLMGGLGDTRDDSTDHRDDRNTNTSTGDTTTTTTTPGATTGKVFSDDFSSYPADSAIDQAPSWSSSDIFYQQGWTVAETSIHGLNHNCINFAPDPWPGNFDNGSNYATFHIDSDEAFDSLALAVDYNIQPNSDMKVYISSDNSNWADVTSVLGVNVPGAADMWGCGFADLSNYIAQLNISNQLYVRFAGAVYRNSPWGMHVATVEVTRNDLERAMLRNELHEVLEFNTLAQLDDYATRNQDAQDGFVMTDVHGNRVRVAQYIFRPDDNDPNDTTVRLVNLNYRSGGGDLAGMTSAIYEIKFNKKPPANLRSLPWDDYFGVRCLADDTTPPQEVYSEYEGEIFAIIHSGIPQYWPTQFSVKVTNPHNDYYRVTEIYEDMTAPGGGLDPSYFKIFKDFNGNIRQAYIQMELEDAFRIQVAKAGNVIFDMNNVQMKNLGIDNETVHTQDPNTMDPVRFSDTYWTDASQQGKIKLDWLFYIIDHNGNRMPFDVAYTDSSHTTTENRLFRACSVRDVLDYRRLGNLEIVFTCSDGAGNSLITAPIDVVIPQGNSDPDHPGILRHYDINQD